MNYWYDYLQCTMPGIVQDRDGRGGEGRGESKDREKEIERTVSKEGLERKV